MAANTDDKTDGCIFQWKIENVSHCWLKTNERISSPAFIVDAVEGTKWSLSLYPMGGSTENWIAFYLVREEDSYVTDEIKVKYQLAFLDKHGSILYEETLENEFYLSDFHGSDNFVEQERVFVSEKEAFLSNDTLTVQCKIWDIEETPAKPKHLYARTVFKVNRKSFIWRIDKFRTLKSGLKNKFNEDLIDFDIYLNEELNCEKEVVININSFEESIKYISFKIFFVDSNGKKETIMNREYFADDLKNGSSVSAVQFINQQQPENKSRLVPRDVLSLHCEYVISAVTSFYDCSDFRMPSPKLKTEVLETKNQSRVGKEKSVNISSLVNDLKSLYTDVILCDVKLRTSTHNFRAHRNILSARSPVFRSMFINDMKEKNCDHVDITDFDDDTIRRMLLFMYTDSPEDLQFESAYKLYKIADKYEVTSLKSVCSSFLKDNLCFTKACEVLVLADLYNDDDLLNDVQDFILGQPKDFFCSQEWKQFINSHSKLAADVMVRKISEQ